MSREEYVTCEVEFKTCTKNALLIAHDDEEHWIPRSLIAWSSDKELDRYTRGMIIDLKLYAWKAFELGLEH